MPVENDTITAIATPIGRAGIGIIRISGPRAEDIVKTLFRPSKAVSNLKSHHLYLGHLHDPETGDTIDEVLLSLMRSPDSYTREDVVEINSHSGYMLLSKILETVIRQGARLAEPGEFTFRAFINGRIDLTQAEAVVDLINSQSLKGLSLASQQIKGSFRDCLYGLREETLKLLAQTEAAIDFPEEENEILSRQVSARKIEKDIIKPIDSLIKEGSRNRLWVDGVKTIIVGRVNAGKSSLLNRLLDEQRAIVTPIPGTTRDIVESTVTIEGIPLRLMDSAGFRDVTDEVEELGIELTRQKLAEADLILIVIDQSRDIETDDIDLVAKCAGRDALIVLNKIDLPPGADRHKLEEKISGLPVIEVSALTGSGLEGLKKAISRSILNGEIDMISSHATSNARHQQALKGAASYFRQAAANAQNEAPLELMASDLKSGLDALGTITGETTTEDILDSIFSQFCLGK